MIAPPPSQLTYPPFVYQLPSTHTTPHHLAKMNSWRGARAHPNSHQECALEHALEHKGYWLAPSLASSLGFEGIMIDEAAVRCRKAWRSANGVGLRS